MLDMGLSTPLSLDVRKKDLEMNIYGQRETQNKTGTCLGEESKKKRKYLHWISRSNKSALKDSRGIIFGTEKSQDNATNQ